MKEINKLALIGAFVATSLVSHASTVVIGPATVEGSGEIGEPVNGYGSYSGNTVQFVLPNSILGSLQNSSITGLAFRLDNSYDPSLPAFGYEQMKIQIGYTSATNLAGQTNISSNIAGSTDSVTAFDQAFYYAPNAFPTGAAAGSSTPNGFGPFISFTNSFAYTTGNLLVTIRHNVPVTPQGTSFHSPSYYSSDAENIGTSVVIGNGVNATSGFNYRYTPVVAFTNDAIPANYSVSGGGTSAVPEVSGHLALIALGSAGVLTRRRITRKA